MISERVGEDSTQRLAPIAEYGTSKPTPSASANSGTNTQALFMALWTWTELKIFMME
jgi:hypothetical protein